MLSVAPNGCEGSRETTIKEKFTSVATMNIPHGPRDFHATGKQSASSKNAEFRFKRGRRIGIEYKCADAPTMANNLKLDELMVLYPGDKHYMLTKGVEVVPLAELVNAK